MLGEACEQDNTQTITNVALHSMARYWHTFLRVLAILWAGACLQGVRHNMAQSPSFFQAYCHLRYTPLVQCTVQCPPCSDQLPPPLKPTQKKHHLA